MTTPRPPGLNRPSMPPMPMLRRSWAALVATVAVIAALVAIPLVLSGMDRSVPIADRDLTPSCGGLDDGAAGLTLPTGIRPVDGQFVYQTGSSGTSTLVFSAVPGSSLTGVLDQVSTAARSGGYAVTGAGPVTPLAEPVRGYGWLEQRGSISVAGPAGRGTITVSGRCADEFAVAYELSR
jgi:hypothetical protein